MSLSHHTPAGENPNLNNVEQRLSKRLKAQVERFTVEMQWTIPGYFALSVTDRFMMHKFASA